MRYNRLFLILSLLVPTICAALLYSLAGNPTVSRSGGLQVLIVGGGPEPEANQVAIERNVYYVSRLLPTGVPRITLFADGSRTTKTVLYEQKPRKLPPEERVFTLLFGSREDASPTVERFRAPNIGKLDGAARPDAIARSFGRLRRSAPDSVLLYFTGHGSESDDGNLDNNVFDLWNGGHLSVRDLATHIASLPPDTSVTLVMVQCFSGAFGNVIFKGGDPAAALVDRDIAGFFATTRERMAAGCTPEVDEAEYRDFTSYFFAALSGKDRVGRKVTGADYNRDGRVGMDEAFAYSLIYNVSIDVPTCTSDVFLRRFVPAENEEVYATSYSQVHAWATPAQKKALSELSRTLKLTGEKRLAEAYRMMTAGMRRGEQQGAVEAAATRFSQVRRAARQPLLNRWPQLSQRQGAAYGRARTSVLAEIKRRLYNNGFRELLASEEALSGAEEGEYQAELAEARVLRFLRLTKSVVLAHRLAQSDNTAIRQRFKRLVAAEARSFLPASRSSSQ